MRPPRPARPPSSGSRAAAAGRHELPFHLTASTGARWLPRRHAAHHLALAAQTLAPVVLTNLGLWAVLALLGHGTLFALWGIAWLTTFGIFVRVRAIAEHACTDDGPDAWRNTRTTRANPVARLFIAPHGVNYHLEHHLLMTVPCYRLRAFHAVLCARDAYRDATPIARGYLAALAEATRTA